MIKNFLIINFIGEDDKLGLRINKDFFTHKFVHKKNNDQLVFELLKFLNSYNATLDENFSVIVNQGPGRFSSVRTALSVAKGLEISKKVMLFGFKNNDLQRFDLENIEKIIDKNLIEKKLIKPIYIS